MNRIKEFLDKYRRYIVICTGILLILFFYVCCTYSAYSGHIKKVAGNKNNKPNIYSVSKNTEPVILQGGDRLVQTFTLDGNGMSSILIKCVSDNPQDGGNAVIELTDSDTGAVISRWEKPLGELRETGYINLPFEEAIFLQHRFSIVISLDDTSEDGTLTLFCSRSDLLGSGVCTVNDAVKGGDINFKVSPAGFSNGFLLKWLAIICISMTALTIFAWVRMMIGRQYKTEHIFLAFILIMGTIYVFIMPPFSVPDEPAHYTTAYHISNNIMGVKEPGDGGVVCRESDKDDEGTFLTTANLSLYRQINDHLFDRTDDTENTGALHVGFIISGASHAHLPQALGITAARLLGLDQTGLLIMGRMFAVLFYAFMVYFAIRIIPVGKNILFAISSLPMLLHEVASFSYDCNIIAMAFLLTSYFLYLIYEKERLELKDYIIVAVLSLLLAPCKMIYFPIVLLAIAIPRDKTSDRLRTLFIKAVVPAGAAFTAVMVNAATLSNASGGDNIIVWANEKGYTISYVLSHIPHTIRVFLNTLYEKIDFYVDSLIGGSLGWFQVDIPEYLTMLSMVILVIALFGYRKYRIRIVHRILYVVIFVCISALIMATMLVGWTPLSYNVIEGVQGRYFLPILPLLMLACRLEATEKQMMMNQRIVIMGACMVNYLVVLNVFSAVLNT